MRKPSFSLSTYVKFTVPQNFVMMLTLKIFVPIMSMVSLTHQMNPSGERPYLNFLGRWLIKHGGRHYRAHLNLWNPFRENTDQYECFYRIRLYCETQNNQVTSDDCAKKGILLYHKEDADTKLWVDEFFEGLPLNPGELKLPDKFCEGKAPRCGTDLQDYSAILEADDYPDQKRKNIAYFALIHRQIRGLTEENFELHYLNHISGQVSSAYPQHNPHSFCERPPPVHVTAQQILGNGDNYDDDD